MAPGSEAHASVNSSFEGAQLDLHVKALFLQSHEAVVKLFSTLCDVHNSGSGYCKNWNHTQIKLGKEDLCAYFGTLL